MPRKLSILGMNARNLRFFRPYNRRVGVKIADDKLLTKRVLDQHGLPNQKLFAVITRSRDLKEFRWNKLPSSFVIKPNRGFGGGGIVVIKNKKRVPKGEEPRYVAVDKSEWTISQLESHIRDILDGRFSLTNSPDMAFIEERIKLHDAFESYSFRGIPDIRVIVFNKVPVMAMVRLPTERSKGKANLSLGAVAVGLEMSDGTATSATIKKPRREIVERHPDNDAVLLDLVVPHWDEILEIAVKSGIASRLGFIGVDIALDKDKGPIVMELNARPGLEIQVSNLAALGSRLERVEGIKYTDVKRSVRLAKDLFGGEIERRVEDLSGRHVLGVVESLEVVTRQGKRLKTTAKIDTGAGLTAIDLNFAVRVGFKSLPEIISEFKLDQIVTRGQAQLKSKQARQGILDKHKEIVGTALIHSSHGSTFRLLVPITYYMAGVKITTKATVVAREHMDYPIIVGQRDLKNFLIDPNQT